jgi:hypothetical protein
VTAGLLGLLDPAPPLCWLGVLGCELLPGAGLSGLHASKLANAANAREYEDVLGVIA